MILRIMEIHIMITPDMIRVMIVQIPIQQEMVQLQEPVMGTDIMMELVETVDMIPGWEKPEV